MSVVTEKWQWRIWQSWWNRDGECGMVLHQHRTTTAPKDVPDDNAPPPVVPFLGFASIGEARRGWRAAREGLWVPKAAVRAHMSPVMQYVSRGSGWEYEEALPDTTDVWFGDHVKPSKLSSNEWDDKIAALPSST